MAGVDALLGLVCCGLLWLRRRWPLGLMVATLPLTLFSMAAAIPLLIFYFTVVVHRRTAVAVAVTGVGLVTNLVFSWTRPDPIMPVLGHRRLGRGDQLSPCWPGGCSSGPGGS